MRVRSGAAGATRLTVTEAARRFSEVVGRAAYQGQRFVLVKGGRVVAELGPPGSGEFSTGASVAAAWRRRPRLSRREAAAFARDVRDAIRESGLAPPTDPWA